MKFPLSRKKVCVWKTVWTLGASLVILFSCLPAFSQGGLGTINGTVTSMASGPVAGATVTVIDLARGESRPLTTDASGLYSAAALTPGAYTVRVEAMGFKTMEHTGITLPTGATLTVDFVMQPGAQSEVVTITAEVLPANANAVVENRQISEAPVNGRNFVNLVENRASGQSTLPGSSSNSRTSNGMRTDQNDPLIDGIYDGDIDTGWQNVNGFGFQGGIDPDVLLPLDSIGEINNTNYPRAEYGWHVGNTTNIGIKSGTNTVHGTLYGFGRDADLNTRNPFRPPPGSGLQGAGKTQFAMEQWGASLGGKIKADKLFYFMNYERERYNVGATSQITSMTDYDLSGGSPTAAQSSTNALDSIPDAIYTMLQKGEGGLLKQVAVNMAGCGGLNVTTLTSSTPLTGPGSITAGCAAGANLAPNGTNSFGTGFAAPVNVFNSYGPTDQFAFGVNSVGGPDAGLIKMDYHINNQNSVNGEFLVENASSDGWTKVSVQPWWLIDSQIRMYIMRGVWVYTPNSSMVNEARFGADLVHETTAPSDCSGVNNAPNYNSIWGFDTGGYYTCEMPFTTLSGGFTSLSISPGAGPYTSEPRNWIGIDSFSWTRGKHVIKVGVEIRRGIFTGSGGGGTGPPLRGTIAYGTTPAFSGGAAGTANVTEDFLSGVPTNETIYTGSATGITPNVYANYYAGFLMDTIRLTRKVTVDLGVRYEFQPAYYQQNNLEGTFNLSEASGLGQEQSGVPLYHEDTWRHNFGPRGGLAWDVLGNGKTVVRVNGGIMYAMSTYSGLSSMQNIPNGATFFAPMGVAGGACSPVSNGTTSTTPTANTSGTFMGYCTFANVGQNGISQGTISSTGGLTYAVCNPSLINYVGAVGCGSGPVSTTASAAAQAAEANTVYGSLLSKGLVCGDGLPVAVGNPLTNPPPCNIGFPMPNLYLPYITSWTTSLQQAVGRNLSLNISYVGNHGTGIRQQLDLNQPLPGPKNGAASTSIYAANLEQDRRPYTTNCPNGTIPGVVTGYTSGPCLPWIAQVLVEGNSDVSNYDAMLATLSLRAFHGVTGNINYTLSHCLDIFSMNENIWTYLSNSRDPQADYGTCTTGTPQRITGNFNWAIPGHRSPAQLLQGWAINGTVTLLPNRYVAFTDTSDDVGGVGNGTGLTSAPGDKWDIFGTPRNFKTFGLTNGGSTMPCFGVSTTFGTSGGCTGSNGTTTVTLNGASYTVPSLGPGGICTTDALLLPNGPSSVSSAATAVNGFTVPANTAMFNLLTFGCYVQGGSVMLPPAQGDSGDMSRNCCLGPGFFETDFSLTKEFGFLKEQRLKAQFRVEVFNLFNNVNLSGPSANLGSPKTFGQQSSTPNTGATIVTGVGGEREVQLGMKFIW